MTTAAEAYQEWFQSIEPAYRPANNLWFGELILEKAWLAGHQAGWKARGKRDFQSVKNLIRPEMLGETRHLLTQAATAIAKED